jgi:phenylalanyl-tRNA synthetase beta chain
MGETLPAQWSNTALEREEQTRDVLAGLGLRENITHRFVTPDQEALSIPRSAGAEASVGVNRPDNASYVTIANPVQPDKTAMRQSIVSNMLNVARNNLRHTPRNAAFEIGPVYFRRDGQELPDEPRRLGIVLAGQRSTLHWEPTAAGNFDFYDLKGVVEALLEGLHVQGGQIVPGGPAWLHPGRSASLNINGQSVGAFGELHPLSAQTLDLPEDVRFYIAEFDADALLGAIDPLYIVGDIHTTPPVYEDLALVVAEAVPAGDVLAALQASGGQFLRAVTLFDVYRGGSVAEGQKSLAFSVVYQAEDHTLSEAEIAATRKKLIKAAQKQFEAVLRG